MTNDFAYRLFSVDDHLIEPPGVFVDRVPERMREAAPHVEEAEGRQFWVWEGRRQEVFALAAAVGRPRSEWGLDPVRYADMIRGAWDPAARAVDLMSQGIVASVCFPSLAGFAGRRFLRFQDRELADACIEAYNDWMLDEWCAGGPEGLYVPMIIPKIWDAEETAREIYRCAERGNRAITLPENTVPLKLPSYWDEHWDPMWRALEETSTTVCLHFGTSGRIHIPTPDVVPTLGYTLNPVNSQMSCLNLVMSPVPQKFPGLNFVMSEGGIGWVAYLLERADHVVDRHREWVGHPENFKPSEIFARQFYVCVVDEKVGMTQVDLVGADRIMWECDYPHPDSVYPDCQQVVHENFEGAGIEQSKREMITYGNAARVFNWTGVDWDQPAVTAAAAS